MGVSMEQTNGGKTSWLAIQGVPLHAWNQEVFTAIAKEWEEVLEVEDLTASKDQLFIGRVRIVTQCRGLISECANLVVDGVSFAVCVMEDSIEIMDFGSPAGSIVAESPAVVPNHHVWNLSMGKN